MRSKSSRRRNSSWEYASVRSTRSPIAVSLATRRPFACYRNRPTRRGCRTWCGEMNLSETAFARRLGPGSKFNLRWFTPTKEVDLCGHATLATAHILWEEGHLPPGEMANFETRSGLLTAQAGPDGIELDFPAEPVHETVTDQGEIAELQSAIGAPVQFAGRNRFDLLVEIESEALVRSLRPDIRRLAQFPVRGVIVTGRSSSPDYHFVSRFFAPRSASTKTPSAARPIAAWDPTGPRSSIGRH